MTTLPHLEVIRPDTPDIGGYVQEFYRLPDTEKEPYVQAARAVYEMVEGLPRTGGNRERDLALHHARQILSFYEHFSLRGNPQADYRDERGAENLRWWRQRTGDRIAYWASSGHTANAPGVQVPALGLRADSAGSHLRSWYGQKYRSVRSTSSAKTHGRPVRGR